MLVTSQDLGSVPFPPISVLHLDMRKILCLLKLIKSVHIRKSIWQKNSPLAKNQDDWENSDFIKGTDFRALD